LTLCRLRGHLSALQKLRQSVPCRLLRGGLLTCLLLRLLELPRLNVLFLLLLLHREEVGVRVDPARFSCHVDP
jgi:hypothetical protein